MITFTDKEITRLQNNLQLIRLAGGWSLAEFGNLLGVSKQTASNLEGSNKNRSQALSKLQYIGIRVILEDEVQNNLDNKLLAYAVYLTFRKEEPTTEELNRLRSAVSITTGAKTIGLDSSIVISSVASIIGLAAIEILSDSELIIKAINILNNKDK